MKLLDLISCLQTVCGWQFLLIFQPIQVQVALEHILYLALILVKLWIYGKGSFGRRKCRF